MFGKKGKTGKKTAKVILVICIIILGIVAACAAYLGDYYHADMERIEAFSVENYVEMEICEKNNISFEPEGATTGFIFYPGGKVEYTAYIPLIPQPICRKQICLYFRFTAAKIW